MPGPWAIGVATVLVLVEHLRAGSALHDRRRADGARRRADLRHPHRDPSHPCRIHHPKGTDACRGLQRLTEIPVLESLLDETPGRGGIAAPGVGDRVVGSGATRLGPGLCGTVISSC